MLYRVVVTNHMKNGATTTEDISFVVPYSIFPDKESAKKGVTRVLMPRLNKLRQDPHLQTKVKQKEHDASIMQRNPKTNVHWILADYDIFPVKTENDEINTKNTYTYRGYRIAMDQESTSFSIEKLTGKNSSSSDAVIHAKTLLEAFRAVDRSFNKKATHKNRKAQHTKNNERKE